MRYAVLADIHANLDALAAILEVLAEQRIDKYLCLGDVVGYGAEPSACIQRVDAYRPIIVAGNHDFACAGVFDVAWFSEAARSAALWTQNQLDHQEQAWLGGLPLTAIEGPCTLVHGTLTHSEQFDYLLDETQAIETMAACKTLICLVGHTHLPRFFEYDNLEHRMLRVLTGRGGFNHVAYDDDIAKRRYLINPGSVGQPRDGNPQACCAIIDTDCRHISMLRAAYDVEAAQRKIRAAGLPDILAERLSFGR